MDSRRSKQDFRPKVQIENEQLYLLRSRAPILSQHPLIYSYVCPYGLIVTAASYE